MFSNEIFPFFAKLEHGWSPPSTPPPTAGFFNSIFYLLWSKLSNFIKSRLIRNNWFPQNQFLVLYMVWNCETLTVTMVLLINSKTWTLDTVNWVEWKGWNFSNFHNVVVVVVVVGDHYCYKIRWGWKFRKNAIWPPPTIRHRRVFYVPKKFIFNMEHLFIVLCKFML